MALPSAHPVPSSSTSYEQESMMAVGGRLATGSNWQQLAVTKKLHFPLWAIVQRTCQPASSKVAQFDPHPPTQSTVHLPTTKDSFISPLVLSIHLPFPSLSCS
jgi:hypothetical protein